MLDELLETLRDPSRVPDAETVEALNERYPYFQLPAALMLQRCRATLDPAAASRLRTRLALTSADQATVYRFAGESGERFADFYAPEENPTPATDDAITTFLERYCNTTPEENALLERLIFNPVPDYGSQLAAQEEAPADAPAEAHADTPESLSALLGEINAPAAPADDEATAEPTPEPAAPAPAAPARPAHHSSSGDSTFSESLAKIYIRQQKFDKALEIISGLRLKFPEKSVYFADQIRFLQKLILNRNYKSQQ